VKPWKNVILQNETHGQSRVIFVNLENKKQKWNRYY